MNYKALGIHVQAGGFTAGVQKHFDVLANVATSDFGRKTVEEVWGIPSIWGVSVSTSDDLIWADIGGSDISLVYGNPTVTQIKSFADFALRQDAPIVIWESDVDTFVTQDETERFIAHGYRVAHILLSTQTFGNAQKSKRYAFVAYKPNHNFNITPPKLSPYYATCYDALWALRNRPTHIGSGGVYDFDSYNMQPNIDISTLPNGWDLETLRQYSPNAIPECLVNYHRLNWLRPYPTIAVAASIEIHPSHNRPVTVGECATAAGWGGKIPQGPRPFMQLASCACPAVGEWLALQAKAYLDDAWGTADWESSYSPTEGKWLGGSASGSEKLFDMLEYIPRRFDERHYDVVTPVQEHKYVDSRRRRLSR